MKKERVLIIKKNNSDVFLKFIKEKKIENYYTILNETYLFKIARKLGLPFFALFFGKWKKEIYNYDKIILFDNGFRNSIAKYIKKRNPNIKTVLWFWNPVTEYSQNFLKNRYIDEFWSYNKYDAKKYNLKYNSQFYSQEVVLKKAEVVNDILFLGTDKGRKESLNRLNTEFQTNGIITNFQIIEKSNQYISYEKYLDLLASSKCILDYNLEINSPLTLRVMEALFLQKKLVTNNLDIINYDFYNANNIFVIGKDNIEDIKGFIDSKYQKINPKIIEKYDFSKWLSRFGE